MLGNARLLIRVTAPAVAVGLLLLAACFAGVRYINRIQHNLADILADNVTRLQAAQELELDIRQLRFHNLLYLTDPTPERLHRVVDDQNDFESALEMARRPTMDAEEAAVVERIAAGYQQFEAAQADLRREAQPGKPLALLALVDSHPVHAVIEPCQQLLRINKDRMDRTADEAKEASSQGYWAMILLGVAGPISGVVMGYGVARGLRHSIYRLSVRVQDMAQHLEKDVATVSVVADGDFQSLDKQMQRIVGQVEDVASRLQQQQRKLLRAEQLAAVGQLAAGVAHEVRNPLTGIKILVEAAQRPTKPRPLDSEDLQVIHRELGRVEKTVQGLLDYARLPPMRLADTDLRDVVDHAVKVIAARAEQQKVEVRISEPKQPVVASVDGDQLHTVLVNLLQNALDAMAAGGRIEIAWQQTADTVRFTIADTGPGIPAELNGKLFTPFTTTKTTGTGLGLTLSARIIEEHGGTLTAENRPEGGAILTIVLPVLARRASEGAGIILAGASG